LIVRASRVKKVVANSAQSHQVHSYMRIRTWTSAEADRKRGKKRGLRAVRGKVAPAPGGCNQKRSNRMTIRKRGTRYYYDFMIRRQRYRGAIPEARTKAEAEQAETKIKNKVYERKYGKISASRPFAEFVRGTYLPWARANKRSRKDDEFHAKVFCRHFGNRSLSEIDHQMIEEFKLKRMESVTRFGRTRKPGSVNRELAILSGIFQDGC